MPTDKSDKIKIIPTAWGAQLARASVDPIVGNKSIYHGTSRKAWESIKKEGLDPRKGATGGATDGLRGFAKKTGQDNPFMDEAADNFKRNSKNKIHYTGNKTIARAFSFLSGAGHGDRGKVVRVKMPQADWDNFKKTVEMDKDLGPQTNPDQAGAAFKTKKKVNTDAFSNAPKAKYKRGKALLKQFPSYIKNNKGRLGKGIAAATIGTALLNYGVVNPIKEKLRKKTASIQMRYFIKDASLRDAARIGIKTMKARKVPLTRAKDAPSVFIINPATRSPMGINIQRPAVSPMATFFHEYGHLKDFMTNNISKKRMLRSGGTMGNQTGSATHSVQQLKSELIANYHAKDLIQKFSPENPKGEWAKIEPFLRSNVGGYKKSTLMTKMTRRVNRAIANHPMGQEIDKYQSKLQNEMSGGAVPIEKIQEANTNIWKMLKRIPEAKKFIQQNSKKNPDLMWHTAKKISYKNN